MLELSLRFSGPALIFHFGFSMLSRRGAVFLQLKSWISLTKPNPKSCSSDPGLFGSVLDITPIHRRHYYQEYKQVIISHGQPGFWWVSPGSVSVHCLFSLVVWMIEVMIWWQNLQLVGWELFQALWSSGLWLRLTLAHDISALHKMKFSIRSSKAFFLVGQNQLWKVGKSVLDRNVCWKGLGFPLDQSKSI